MAAIDTGKTCDAGYVCVSGASTNTPTDGTTGYQCPTGSYCEAGSAIETPCLIGTYRDTAGATAAGDCTTCSGSVQCNERGMTGPGEEITICNAGNYCLDGNVDPCDPGYYCEVNVEEQTACDSGYYQPNSQQSECLECPEGYYCPQDMAAGTPEPPTEALPCPVGQYCPRRSQNPTDCGTGYYRNAEGAGSVGDCMACAPGFTCNDSTAIDFPTSACSVGFYCPEGGVEIACPVGHYCD